MTTTTAPILKPPVNVSFIKNNQSLILKLLLSSKSPHPINSFISKDLKLSKTPHLKITNNPTIKEEFPF